MKDVRAHREPAFTADHYFVKRKGICPVRKRIKEDNNEMDVEIKIKSPKYKLNLFHDESIKHIHKIRA
jgi:hypothetical protein